MDVRGFKAGAVSANIRYGDRPDLGIILSSVSAVTAAVFTRNIVKAAPVLDSIELLSKGRNFRAIVVNSGTANACTGERGLSDCLKIRQEAASALGIEPHEVLVASTGVIGAYLPMDRYLKGIKEASRKLSEEGFLAVSEAILTTDTRNKVAMREVEIEGTLVKVLGMAKGAGMISPSMGPPQATMLSFILTDAYVDEEYWQEIIERCVDLTFNRITVDGDMSTNDTVIGMANGFARNRVADGQDPESTSLEEAVYGVMKSLSQQIVMDGEGATKCVTIRVAGARSEKDAELCARAISNSNLVKTAFFGEDPNWGRIIAAAGYSGAKFTPKKSMIKIGDVEIFRKGEPTGGKSEDEAKIAMKKPLFKVEIDLGAGKSSFEMLTCDLSTEYVHINADYRS